MRIDVDANTPWPLLARLENTTFSKHVVRRAGSSQPALRPPSAFLQSSTCAASSRKARRLPPLSLSEVSHACRWPEFDTGNVRQWRLSFHSYLHMNWYVHSWARLESLFFISGVCMCIYMYARVYMHLHIYIHTYIYTHIHTYTQRHTCI